MRNQQNQRQPTVDELKSAMKDLGVEPDQIDDLVSKAVEVQLKMLDSLENSLDKNDYDEAQQMMEILSLMDRIDILG